MRRKLAVAVLAAGLFAVAACDGNSGGGGSSNEEVCERVDTEGADAFGRFEEAGEAIGVARQSGDQLQLLGAVADAQSAVDDLVEVLRDGASDASDDELRDALNGAADEVDAYVDGLDADSLLAGEVPDASGIEAAFDAVDQICAST